VSKGYILPEQAVVALQWHTDDADTLAFLEDEVIPDVEDAIDTYCQTTFVAENSTVKLFDGSGLAMQSLGLYLRSLTSVWLLDTSGDRLEELTDVVMRPNPPKKKDGAGNNLYSWLQRRQPPNLMSFDMEAVNKIPHGVANIEITGNWGCVVVPRAVRRAMVLGIKHHLNLNGYDGTKKLESGFGRTVEYMDSDKIHYLPEAAKAILNPWKYRGFTE
jgi:hypothetical protein